MRKTSRYRAVAVVAAIPRSSQSTARTPRAPEGIKRAVLSSLLGAHAGAVWAVSAVRLPRRSERAHRVPRGEDNRLLIERGEQLCGQVLLTGGDLEHVLVVPGVIHRVEPLLAILGAPGILDPPAARRAVHHVHAGEEHRVRHLRLVEFEPGVLLQPEGRAVDRAILEEF